MRFGLNPKSLPDRFSVEKHCSFSSRMMISGNTPITGVASQHQVEKKNPQETKTSWQKKKKKDFFISEMCKVTVLWDCWLTLNKETFTGRERHRWANSWPFRNSTHPHAFISVSLSTCTWSGEGFTLGIYWQTRQTQMPPRRSSWIIGTEASSPALQRGELGAVTTFVQSASEKLI